LGCCFSFSSVQANQQVKSGDEIKTEVQDVKNPPSEIQLDRYNSELHVRMTENNTVGEIVNGAGFEYMWGGARATHGVKRGMVRILLIYYKFLLINSLYIFKS